MKRSLTLGAVSVLAFSLCASEGFAKSDPVTNFYVEVAKKGVEQAVAFGLGEIYDAGCNTPDNPVKLDAMSSLGCSIARAGAGRAEDEFKNELRNGLAEIKEVVTRIESQVTQLGQGQAEILTALDRIEAEVQVVPIETVAELATSGINDAWAAFLPVMNGTEQVTPDEMIDLATRIVNSYKIADKLRALSGAVSEPTLLTKDSLLQQQMNLLLVGMDSATSNDLELPHQFYQGVMRNILVQYGRGEMMYAWAASVLEAVCSEGGAGCVSLPVSLANFETRSNAQRTVMLLHYRDMVERLVLAYSDPSSTNRNFLHDDARQVFAELDFFLALNLESHGGLRGRVISAGSAFQGTLEVSGEPAASEVPRDILSSRDIDWWTRPAANKPYDRVHFAPSWRIYDVVLQAEPDQVLQVTEPLPWHSGDFQLLNFDTRNGELATADTPQEDILPFGTFTAIARAGGSYAMMYEAWAVFGERDGMNNYGTRSQPAVAAFAEGNVWFNPSRIGQEGAAYGGSDASWIVRRASNITLVDGGKITLHGRFGDAEDIRAGRTSSHRNSEIPRDAALHMHVNFRPSILSSYSSVSLHAGVYLARSRGENGITWTSSKTITEPVRETVEHNGEGVVTVTYAPGEVLSPSLRARMESKIYANGYTAATNYTLFSGVAPTALYLTR
ncbi:hypothetical protein [Puniceibacterium sediminis]|uniref:Uncharacterized protein n=1 Tax=Puniceibacterium sediminis TaxID=1608407 RepID=A0A238X8T7_9RHOB|nr:hypothetical protein [Puniceibacterium sediminis]SNR54249.1 hypothetical protein SAMN06265370_10999 [Puniceibacterium sediminis]